MFEQAFKNIDDLLLDFVNGRFFPCSYGLSSPPTSRTPSKYKIKNMGNAGRNGWEYYIPHPLIRPICSRN